LGNDRSHRRRSSRTELHYEGSCAIDETLLETAHVSNTNRSRLRTSCSPSWSCAVRRGRCAWRSRPGRCSSAPRGAACTGGAEAAHLNAHAQWQPGLSCLTADQLEQRTSLVQADEWMGETTAEVDPTVLRERVLARAHDHELIAPEWHDLEVVAPSSLGHHSDIGDAVDQRARCPRSAAPPHRS
jgi:hypothetical protein